MPPRSDLRRYTPWEYLRSQRLGAELTLRDLARATGLAYSHVCQLEQGRCGPSDDAVLRLAHAVKCDPRKLDATKPAVPSRDRNRTGQGAA